jgi:hypothetical protein
MKACWSCQTHGRCAVDCLCAKCVDPAGYAQWRADHPEQYAAWLERQEDSDCTCPECAEHPDECPCSDCEEAWWIFEVMTRERD